MARLRTDPLRVFGVPFTSGYVALHSFGNTWYVDGTNGNDGNKGNSIEKPLKTIQKADDKASSNDLILIAPGSYDETVTVATDKLTFVGLGGRGSVFIEPSAAGAEGMQITSDDVTLVNIGVDGDDTADYSLNLNTATRFRAFGCKFELGDGTGPAVLINGDANDQTADALFEDCEFAWAGTGIQFDDSGYGYPTQIFVKNCRFHNLATAGLGLASGGGVNNLHVIDSVFDDKEDGTAPTDYILVNRAGDTGIISGCRFATATNATGVLTIAADIMWVANGTEAGWSTARPA